MLDVLLVSLSLKLSSITQYHTNKWVVGFQLKSGAIVSLESVPNGT